MCNKYLQFVELPILTINILVYLAHSHVNSAIEVTDAYDITNPDSKFDPVFQQKICN